MQVAVQPCGNSAALKHYVDTIKNLVPLTDVLPHLSATEEAEVLAVFGSRTAMWGVTPGKGGQNRTKWNRLAPGDIALMYREKRIFSRGRIVLTLHNKSLAEALWKTDPQGNTWEYIYFLDDLEELDIPLAEFNRVMGYATNNVIQGFNVYGGDKAEALLGLLEIGPEEAFPVGAVSDPAAIHQKLADLQKTDEPAPSKTRKEAGLFRDLLFGTIPTATCDLCLRELPVGFLVAAHIKPRASCTHEERVDPSVVMRACKLGCDELYERAYICVNEGGQIEAGVNWEGATKDLHQAGKALLGQRTSAFSSKTANYFEWHRTHPRRLVRAS